MNKHAAALGKLGGKVRSEAKAKASRDNGKLGGRPKKNLHLNSSEATGTYKESSE